ncbi:carbamoyl-phosphate synthase small subunit [Kerstersia gyiorum]|uniref:Carbamoyl phosphate synthase small chain n=1 Tax=Kerstersia gyiorum TaxID=206506 RepID=A0A4V2EZ21_9BURK|nr:glutamine-hydrolyzing carbamoyl-phosphate synthase small subunit [Kerstersia gyiorum]RZS64970.1 carbamoyl-phosphate synthase small subunit [Kerstersia gyiorum]
MLPSIFPEGVDQLAPAILALADGTVFRGVSIGAPGHAVGEAVFNTAMTGYQEVLTDPSYTGQLVTLTYPHIGNTGINAEDCESPAVCAGGLIVRDCSLRVSNFRSEKSLPAYLREQNVVAISGIDTRKLTRILREGGAQGACILVGDDAEQAIALARAFPGMDGQNLGEQVSTKEVQNWNEGTWRLGEGFPVLDNQRPHVVAYDYGVKRNILRLLVDAGCRVTLVPATMPASEVLAMSPDGVFLSNGPGDPAACTQSIAAVRELLDARVPLFGICLGMQLLGLALGARTIKLSHGHHGNNHPVKELDTGNVYITSQNHGYAVDADSLPANARVTHISLFDGTLQGVELTDRPAFGFQGHPEASPGPRDIVVLFNKFVSLMTAKS